MTTLGTHVNHFNLGHILLWHTPLVVGIVLHHKMCHKTESEGKATMDKNCPVLVSAMWSQLTTCPDLVLWIYGLRGPKWQCRWCRVLIYSLTHVSCHLSHNSPLALLPWCCRWWPLGINLFWPQPCLANDEHRAHDHPSWQQPITMRACSAGEQVCKFAFPLGEYSSLGLMAI